MSPYGNGNLSAIPLQEFVLDGFQTQALLSALFLALYVVAVLGNLAMMVVITLDARLHSPMYFFLKNLSFVGLCYSSVITPRPWPPSLPPPRSSRLQAVPPSSSSSP